METTMSAEKIKSKLAKCQALYNGAKTPGEAAAAAATIKHLESLLPKPAPKKRAPRKPVYRAVEGSIEVGNIVQLPDGTYGIVRYIKGNWVGVGQVNRCDEWQMFQLVKYAYV